MAATNFSQSGADLKIQDDGAHESESMIENSPPRLDGGLGSVTQISMATQIIKTDHLHDVSLKP